MDVIIRKIGLRMIFALLIAVILIGVTEAQPIDTGQIITDNSYSLTEPLTLTSPQKIILVIHPKVDEEATVQPLCSLAISSVDLYLTRNSLLIVEVDGSCDE